MPVTDLDRDTCYRALVARDARFDGRFFVGVSSTRIYCRPVCTVRAPRRDRCRFFPYAAAAEAAGYRPCLRCRPELAPGLAAVDAVERLATRVVRRLDDGIEVDETLAGLARELGVSDRHVRRAFRAALGVSPVAYAQTRRLLAAKQLLTDTAMSITDVAFASGFRSLRRFHASFRSRYRTSPSALRRGRPLRERQASRDAFSFELAYRPPFDVAAMLAFLAGRATQGVEVVAGGRWARTVAANGRTGWVTVGPAGRPGMLAVAVAASLGIGVTGVLRRVRRVFDVDADAAAIDAHLSGDPVLAPDVRSRPGVRVPGAFDGFELLVRAILGQQVSVAAATTLAGRLAERFGAPVATPIPGLDRAAPSAERLAGARAAAIAATGLPRARAEAIRAAARAVADGRLELRPGVSVDATREALLALPGIGPWTADYVTMRALAWPDAFLPGDLGLRRAIGMPAPRAALARSKAWRPWRAYAVMRLWTRPMEDR